MILLTLRLRIVAVAVAAALTAAAGTAATVLWVAESRLIDHLLSSEISNRQRTAALLGSKLEILKASVAAIAKQVQVGQLDDAEALCAFLMAKPVLGVLYDGISSLERTGRFWLASKVGDSTPDGPTSPTGRISPR